MRVHITVYVIRGRRFENFRETARQCTVGFYVWQKFGFARIRHYNVLLVSTDGVHAGHWSMPSESPEATEEVRGSKKLFMI